MLALHLSYRDESVTVKCSFHSLNTWELSLHGSPCLLIRFVSQSIKDWNEIWHFSTKTISRRPGRHHFPIGVQPLTGHYCCCDLFCNIVITNSEHFGCGRRLDEVYLRIFFPDYCLGGFTVCDGGRGSQVGALYTPPRPPPPLTPLVIYTRSIWLRLLQLY